LDRKALTWNTGAERLFGWRAAEVIGKPLEILVPPECRHELSRNVAALRAQGTVAEYDTVRLDRDGRRIEVSVMLSPIRDRSGEMSGVSLIMRDITDRKRTERALKELTATLERKVAERTAALQAVNEHLQSFAYSVSHDLRAPLRAIDGFAKALDENTISLDAENRKRIERIRGGARRMTELIDSLLHLARLGQAQLAAKPHDADVLVHEVAREIGAEYPRVKFEINGLGQTRGDPSLLRQVWVNLIGNAAKFSDKSEHPMVEIGRIEQAGEQVFRVKDNGAGFDMQYAGKLFGLFQRMHRQDEFPGTGAGLAIVKRIVGRHGGRVWAEAAPGKGASFYFTLSVPVMTGPAARESGNNVSSLSG
jgi:PAS domain S-box-containing protein